ncbi:polyserase-2-like isoform X2 [Drosophila elegans]|uniref:polyserase-2-like isoform X2 n=1 Tax=Drosophila elegans TaxID=30023 RepID=UPI001BC833D9|nr:polyserase-2-like isoform X2 [Drosophila elegans]
MQTYLACIFLFTCFPCYLGTSLFLDNHCGYLNVGKVVNGQNANQEYAAWMTAIRNETEFLCGGTLIHNRFVLTAAHCTHKQENFLGAYNKSDPLLKYEVTAAIVHRLWSIHKYQHDICLLKLSESVEYKASVLPICIIVDKNRSSLPARFKTFGWGVTSDGMDSDILQTITLNHLNETKCKSRLGVTLSSDQICAATYNSDTCKGDSGGPLSTTLVVDGIGRETQVGIVSFGLNTCNGPGVYTNVASYVDWIQENINAHDDSNKPQLTNPHQFPPAIIQDMWLHGDCGGETMASILRAEIFGLTFRAQGVLITDRFVITVVRDLQENAAALEVDVVGKGRSYGEYRVDSVLKHSIDDIALLKLNRPVTPPDGIKPICMLSNIQLQRNGEPNSALFVLDNVRISAVNVEFVNPLECPLRTINTNEICAKTPSGMSHTFLKPGDILGQRVMISEKERFVLFGLVSYSYNGCHILTNVMRQTELIANALKKYQAKQPTRMALPRF